MVSIPAAGSAGVNEGDASLGDNPETRRVLLGLCRRLGHV